MSSYIQQHLVDTRELQNSIIISQFLLSFSEQNGATGDRRTATINDLRQLREELEQLSAKAGLRASQLDNKRSLHAETKDAVAASTGRVREALQPSTQAPDAGSANSESTQSSLDNTNTPNTDHPANKRVKVIHGVGSRVAVVSDSDHLTAAAAAPGRTNGSSSCSISSSNVDGGGKYFQTANPVESTSVTAAVTAASSGLPKARHSMGTPVQDDFSRVKVTNQVQIQTFMASLEPYFRTISDEDIVFLENLRDPQESYVVPRLGKFYAQTWTEEEVAHFPDHMHGKTRFTAKHLLDSDSRGRAPLPTTSFPGADLVDSDLTLNSARLAPLTERIISALVAERLVQQLSENVGPSDSESDGEVGARQTPLSGDATSLEDRLKRELRYIGILDDGDVDWDARQDDEVSATLRSLQRQLRDQVAVNTRRKERLLPVAREHIGFQEYTQVIDELDKQVEQSYLKRHRLTKSRKRKSAPTKTVALSDNALNAMDRRRRVINAIGHLFPAEKFALPARSVFEGIQPNPEIDMK